MNKANKHTISVSVCCLTCHHFHEFTFFTCGLFNIMKQFNNTYINNNNENPLFNAKQCVVTCSGLAGNSLVNQSILLPCWYTGARTVVPVKAHLNCACQRCLKELWQHQTRVHLYGRERCSNCSIKPQLLLKNIAGIFQNFQPEDLLTFNYG